MLLGYIESEFHMLDIVRFNNIIRHCSEFNSPRFT